MIQEFSAPNGLCSSITESQHITAVKRPWRRSNRYDVLGQMLLTIQRLDKLAAARVSFVEHGMLPPEHPSVSLSAPEVPENKVADDEGLEDEAINMERVESFMHLPSRCRESDCFELSVLIQNENFIQNEAIKKPCPAWPAYQPTGTSSACSGVSIWPTQFSQPTKHGCCCRCTPDCNCILRRSNFSVPLCRNNILCPVRCIGYSWYAP